MQRLPMAGHRLGQRGGSPPNSSPPGPTADIITKAWSLNIVSPSLNVNTAIVTKNWSTAITTD